MATKTLEQLLAERAAKTAAYEKEQTALAAAIAEARAEGLVVAFASIDTIIAKNGITVEEFAKHYKLKVATGKGGKVSKLKGTPVAPKYQNPTDATKTWAGRGVKPKWYVDAVAKGVKPEAMLIKKPAAK